MLSKNDVKVMFWTSQNSLPSKILFSLPAPEEKEKVLVMTDRKGLLHKWERTGAATMLLYSYPRESNPAVYSILGIKKIATF